MRKYLGLFFLLSTTIGSLKSQVYHEVGLGFSGLRNWELNPPGFLWEDIDYYLSPQFSYQIHFWNERLVAGAQIGWAYENGVKNKENFFREDKRKSVTLDIVMGLNILQFKNGLLQANLGTRLSKSYFFSTFREGRENATSAWNTLISFQEESWTNVRYDFISSVSYQHLFNKSRNTFGLRFSWEVIFPRKSFFLVNGENISSIATGPSVSLIWRIKQRRNRGLY